MRFTTLEDALQAPYTGTLEGFVEPGEVCGTVPGMRGFLLVDDVSKETGKR